jgi:hypothetical protein
MSKLGNRGIPMTLTEDNVLKVAVEQGVIENQFNWKLVREHDGLTNQSKEVLWLEFNEDGRFKAKHDEPGVGRSLIMSPFNDFFTWQTTSVTEIIAATPNLDYVRFKTTNSVYELSRIYDSAVGNPV